MSGAGHDTVPTDTEPRTGHVATTSFGAVAAAISKRGLVRMVRLPSLIFPAIIMPVFFVVAFSGSFAAAVQIEGYGTDKAVNWMTAWAVLQGGAFAGVGSAGAAATDLENGFFDRIRLAPVDPLAVMVGLLGYSMTRALVPVSAVLVVAFAFLDADMPGGLAGLLMVYVGALGMALVIALLAMTVVFTFKTIQSLALVQILTFSMMFLSIGQAPLEAIEGWLHAVATINPVTQVIELTRQGFLGDVTWAATWPGLVALGVMTAVFGGLALWRYRTIT
jgi:ABC-2 type transport system permease protein